MQVRITEPDGVFVARGTVGALNEHDVPPFCDIATVPVKLFTAVTVIVEETATLGAVFWEVGFPEIVKSGVRVPSDITLTVFALWFATKIHPFLLS